MALEDPTSILRGVLAASEKLPAFPDVVWKVMPLIRKMAPVNEIEAVIKYDQAITARVLAISSSSFFARKRSIRSLRDAIVSLGDKQLLLVIMTACSARYFSGETSGYDLREGELWEHAVASALMSEIVGLDLPQSNLLSTYTAALLHDIGKTLLHLHVKTYFGSILALVKEKKISFIEAEREVLGIDHQQLGSIIAKRWNFPAEVVMGIGYHHCPLQAKEHREIAGIIYTVDRMVSAVGIGCGLDGFWQPNEDEVFVKLGIDSRMVDKYLVQLVDILQEMKQFLSSCN